MQVENVTWVPATNDLSANCQRLRDTLASLPTFPAQTVRLAPGVFDCGATTLFVSSDVALEGSGNHTMVVGSTDNSVMGVVHLSGQASLSRLTVWNHLINPANGVIAISAWDFPSLIGSPSLIDVVAIVPSSVDPAYPLWILGEEVKVAHSFFLGGDIRLTGGSYTFTLYGGALEGVDADATVTANCYFFRNLTTEAAHRGGLCP